MQQAVNYSLTLVTSYTNLVITYAGTNGADIRVTQSSAANPTSYAYYPYNDPVGGDDDVAREGHLGYTPDGQMLVPGPDDPEPQGDRRE